MRLLIVEDEYYTRQGIIDEIDLAAIGYDAVEQADDGVNGLRVARTFRPDVILADVRMPRMDGVEMCYSLRRLLPDCSIVFMSGYADKEYLKAAIDLKAASYIEKPFRTRELRDVLERAASLRRQEQERASREADLLRRAEAGAPLLRSEAALMLVQNDSADERVQRAVAASGLALTASTPLAVALVRAAGTGSADSTVDRDRLAQAVDAEAAGAGLDGVVALQGAECAVVVFAARTDGDAYGAPPRALTDRGITTLLERVLDRMGASPCVAGVSATVTGLARAREAYAGAASALDAAFFLGPGSVCHDLSCPRNPLVPSPAAASPFGHAVDDFQACLDREDGEGALSLLQSRTTAMAASGSRDTFQAREFLTRLLLRLVAWCERRGIDPFAADESVRRLSERIERWRRPPLRWSPLCVPPSSGSASTRRTAGWWRRSSEPSIGDTHPIACL